MTQAINQMEPWLAEEEREAMSQYLASAPWLTEFRKTAEFERMIAEFTGASHAIVVANGTLSLTAALWAAGVRAGDEVLVPDYTMLATATAVQLMGARPVFVDIDCDSICMDVDRASEAVTDRTKAIIYVSINGRSGRIVDCVRLCRERKLAMIEDAAQSLGSVFQGQHLGRFGAIGSFSFSAPKVITTGQGGALITDDHQLAESIRKIKDFGRRKAGEDFYETFGVNLKFTDLQAVIGIEQMKKLAWRVARKKVMYSTYKSALEDVDQVRFIPTNLDDVSPWFIDILVPDPGVLRAALAEHKIGSRPFYPALHSQPAFGLAGSFPNAESIARHGLWLPSSSFLTDDDIHRVCAHIRRFYGRSG